MRRITKNLLSIILLIDASISVGFGLYSWFFPYQTFGTILAIPETHSSVFLALLSTLSLFYVLLGLTCLIGIKSTFPMAIRIGLLMIVRHILEGVMKFFDIGKEWVIGNPYPDIVIHSVYIFLYSLAIYFMVKHHQAMNHSTRV